MLHVVCILSPVISNYTHILVLQQNIMSNSPNQNIHVTRQKNVPFNLVRKVYFLFIIADSIYPFNIQFLGVFCDIYTKDEKLRLLAAEMNCIKAGSFQRINTLLCLEYVSQHTPFPHP